MMMVLVAFFQSTQDRDCAQVIRLIHLHDLETAFQSLILLEIFLVFVESRSTDRPQLATC